MNLLSNRRATFVACLLAFASSLVLVVSAQVSRGSRPIEIVDGHEAAAGEVLIKLRGSSDVAQIAQELEADRSDVVGAGNLLRLHSSKHKVTELLSVLSTRSDIEYVEPNFIVHTTSLPNDPAFPLLWGLFNTGQTVNGSTGLAGADINVTPAWDVTAGSRANVVAVVDTGVDYNHPDLVDNMWSAPAAFSVTVAGRTISCPAGTHGFKAITTVTPIILTCYPLDDYYHGTHVAGTVGAVGNNALGVVGVNQVASIMALKFLDNTGSGTDQDAINVIEFAIQAKAAFSGSGLANVRVLSNSWGGGGYSQALLDEIKKANTNGMLFVAAAGNGSSNNDAAPFYPASFNAPNVIAVAATDSRDNLANFSNYGRNTVHLGAPGVNIVSTTPGNSYGYASGTSMATPHVSAAAALVLSRCNLNTADLKTVLLNNVQPIAALAATTITGGRLNVYNSVVGCTANAPPTVTLTGPSDGASYVTPATIPLSATASDGDGIKRVEFYQGTTLIATSASTSNPYTATWSNAAAGSYTLTAKAYDNLNASTVSASVHVTVTTGGGTSVAFVGTDTTTQGSWHGVYGSQGYSIVSDATSLPAYASVSASGQGTYTWTFSTSDVRALQKGTGTDRLAAVWYSPGGFDIDVNLTDGAAHQVAVYVVDWDYGTRAQTIELRDAVSNTLLDIRTMSNFKAAGQYWKWTVTGHVTIRFINTATPNAVMSGLFLDSPGSSPPPSPPPSGGNATFVGTDTTTQGSWHGVYGSQGYSIVSDATSLPAYASVSASGQATYTWTLSTSDVRALQKGTGTERLAAVWYSSNAFDIDVNLTDGATHQVAVYVVDWDYGTRAQTIELRDATSSALLDSRTMSDFKAAGQYWKWTVTGHVTIRFINTATPNAVVSGLFLDSPGSSPPPSPPPSGGNATFVGTDTTTQGSWHGVYGSQGYSIVSDATSLPAYASVSASGQATYTWTLSTSDVRALQKGTGTDRLAAVWYSRGGFDIDVNLTDGAAHQVAVYVVDWDYGTRAQTIEMRDAVSNVLLDVRTMSNFKVAGQYWKWAVTGHVTIRVINTASPNAVVSGLFLDP